MLLANPTWIPAFTFPTTLLHIRCPWDPLLTNKKWYFSCQICPVLLLWENFGKIISLGNGSSLNTYFVIGILFIIINALAAPYWLLWWLVIKKKIHLNCRRHEFESLGQEDSMEKGIATHSSILAWEIPWMEETGGLLSVGLQKSWRWQRTKQQ